MTKKLFILLVMTTVLGLAFALASFAKKPDPMPGPPVVNNFDGDVYLFSNTPATIEEAWGKLSFDLWGGAFKFYFKAANLTPLTQYTLSVGTLELGQFTTDDTGHGALAGEVPVSDSFSNQYVTLTGDLSLTSFYPISFLYIAP